MSMPAPVRLQWPGRRAPRTAPPAELDLVRSGHPSSHLIHGDKTDWMPRLAIILEHGESRPFDKFDRHAMLERDQGVPLGELIQRFADLREQSLRQLDDLVSDADLDRPGYHPSLGNVTMRNLLATWAVHDLDHTSQIFGGMSAAYDQTVGPWKQYLGILLRREDPSAVPG